MSPTAIVALGVVGLIAAGVVVAFVRSPYTPRESVFYFANVLLCRFLWRLEIVNPLPVPRGKGAVIVCNHRSSVDPFFIQITTGRLCHWMVAKEFFRIPFVGFFLHTTGAIPTSRGGIDTAAIKAAIRLAQKGELVGMFPEGRINTTDDLLLPVRPGAALVALKAGVPIVPAHIEGAPYRGQPYSPFFMRARVKVRFGEPLDLTAYLGRDREPGVIGEVIVLAMKEVARLAGHDDYQPQLAGRRWLNADEETTAVEEGVDPNAA
jgi:1-acyl-sn-glycerol-3-phosphate acyltransferase